MESEPRANAGANCEAMNLRGERCGKRAVRGRFCLVHAGKQSMAELGSKGGKASVRSRLGLDVLDDDAASDKLRAKARRRLEALLDSDDEALRLRAASALYSYRSQEAPRDQALEQPQHPGRGRFGVAQLVELAGELGVLSQLGGMTETAEQDLVERLKATQAQGQADESATHAPPSPARSFRAPPLPGVPSTSSDSQPETAPAPIASASPDAPDGADFDEAEEAKIERRYGGAGTWRHV